MWKAYRDFWIRGTRIKGNSTRSQYWWVVLCNFIIEICLFFSGSFSIILGILQILHAPTLSFSGSVMASMGALILLALLGYDMVTLVPRYTLLTRRFHDANFSGWWIWIYLAFKLLSVLVAVLGTITAIKSGTQAGNVLVASHNMSNILSTLPGIFVFVVTVLPTGCHKKAFLSKNRK